MRRGMWLHCTLLSAAVLAVCSLAAAFVLFKEAFAAPEAQQQDVAVRAAPTSQHFAGGLLLQATASLHDLVREHPFAPSALLPYVQHPRTSAAPWGSADERWQDRVPAAAIAAYYNAWPQECYVESQWSWRALFLAMQSGKLMQDTGHINAWPAMLWLNNGCAHLAGMLACTLLLARRRRAVHMLADCQA